MHAMSYYHNAVWTAELELPKSKAIRYQYVLVNADDTQLLDSPKYRYLPAHEGDVDVEVRCHILCHAELVLCFTVLTGLRPLL